MDFGLPNRLEAAFRLEISRLLKLWIPDRHAGISIDYWLDELENLSTKKSLHFGSVQLSQSLMKRVQQSNTNTWKEASRKKASTQYINSLLHRDSTKLSSEIRTQIIDNAVYIASIPADVATQLKKELDRGQHNPLDYVRRRFPVLLNSKIAQIARTQANSSNTNLTKARSMDAGLPCFTWQVRHDDLVRYSHLILSNVIVFWRDLPSPETLAGQRNSLGRYAPGDAPNCRCHPEPILSLDDVFANAHSLARVYVDGRIVNMTRTQFTKLSGMEKAA